MPSNSILAQKQGMAALFADGTVQTDDLAVVSYLPDIDAAGIPDSSF